MQKALMSAALTAAFVVAAASAGFAQAQTPQPDPASPNYQATGEQDKSYVFPGTDEKIAYHIYVPMKWNKTTKLPHLDEADLRLMFNLAHTHAVDTIVDCDETIAWHETPGRLSRR